jgi:hypothetical protein
MTFKPLPVPTLGLAGMIAMAAAAGPAVADVLNPVPTFIPVPADMFSNFQPGGARTLRVYSINNASNRGVSITRSLLRYQLRRPGDRKHFYRRPVQCQCRYLFGIQPDISRSGGCSMPPPLMPPWFAGTVMGLTMRETGAHPFVVEKRFPYAGVSALLAARTCCVRGE